MPKGSKPGERRGGRKAGTPNKTTTVVKDGILACYEGIGGDGAFQVWAKANPSEFYTKIYVKVLPLQIGADGNSLKKLVLEWQDSPSSE
jgi:hypothetical protein